MSAAAPPLPDRPRAVAPAPDARADKARWLEVFRRQQQTERDALAAAESTWSWARLAAFAAAVVVWWPLGHLPWVAGGAALAALAAFVVTVRRHMDLRARREAHDRLLAVVDESRRRLGGAVELIRSAERPADDPALTPPLAGVLDDGPLWTLTDQERDDLDLFARPVGLFGLLNRTSTHVGAVRLCGRIDALMLDPAHIAARQAAVSWLAEHPAERITLLAAAAALRKEDRRLARLVQAIESCRPLHTAIPATLVCVWSVVSVALTLGVLALLMLGHLTFGWVLGALLSINMTIYFSLKPHTDEALESWRDTAWAARGWLGAARPAGVLPEEGELGRLRAALLGAVRPGALPALYPRLGWTESGGFIGLLVNSVAFSDLHVTRSILKRVLPHREALLSGISAVADLEVLLSLGCFAWEQPIACVPEVAAEPCIEIDRGRHPLIDPERVVANALRLDAAQRLWIITGSNMAGKSTFLRMIGTNVVLAQMGGLVSAEAMRWSPLRLITDLRARDNLAASESYFLSEVRHLRRMVLPPDGREPLLGLIDEPFRGTNSHDQTAASVAVARHLLASGHLFVLATHDRVLTELADGRAALNFHFRENLGRDGMVFDYRLHDGPATTRNALLVLEKEGYPRALLDEARRWGE